MQDMFGNENVGFALEKISKIPFGGYTGNKRKILSQLWSVLEKENIEFDSIFDAFSGSAAVSLFMKFMGKKVIANDFLTSSYLNALSLVENPGYILSLKEMMFVIYNEPERVIEDGYVYKTYKDIRFTEKECIDLDRFRINVALLDNSYKSGVGFLNVKTLAAKTPFGMVDQAVDMQKHRKKQLEKYGKGSEDHDRRIGLYYDENFNLDFKVWFKKYNAKFSPPILNGDDKEVIFKRSFILRNMESNILQNCFLGGRYSSGQVIAKIEHRKHHGKHKESMHRGISDVKFSEILLADYNKNLSGSSAIFSGEYQPCLALNCDIVELLANTDFVTDVAYIDPPYGGNSSDYAYLYSFLEEYVYGNSMANLEHVQQFGKRFVNKKSYEKNFTKMLQHMNRFPVWLLSYNDSSWESKDHIVSILKNYKSTVNVHSIDNYMYNYRANKSSNSGIEYMIIAY